MNYEIRARLYPILLALSALATFYGLASDEEAALWVALVFAVIGNGTAVAYTRPVD